MKVRPLFNGFPAIAKGLSSSLRQIKQRRRSGLGLRLFLHAVQLKPMAAQFITKPRCNAFLQPLDLLIDELNHLTTGQVDQMVMMIPLSILVSCPAIAKLVTLQNSRLLEQLYGPINRRNGDFGIGGQGASIQFLDIRMIFCPFKNPRDNSALLRHAQAKRFTTFDDRICRHPVRFPTFWGTVYPSGQVRSNHQRLKNRAGLFLDHVRKNLVHGL